MKTGRGRQNLSLSNVRGRHLQQSAAAEQVCVASRGPGAHQTRQPEMPRRWDSPRVAHAARLPRAAPCNYRAIPNWGCTSRDTTLAGFGNPCEFHPLLPRRIPRGTSVTDTCINAQSQGLRGERVALATWHKNDQWPGHSRHSLQKTPTATLLLRMCRRDETPILPTEHGCCHHSQRGTSAAIASKHVKPPAV